MWYVVGTGSDTEGDGSLMHPWATLPKALSSATVVDGDMIVLGPGTYNFTSKIVINKSVAIYSNDINTTIFTYVGAPDASGTFITIAKPNVVLANLTINAQGSSPIKWCSKSSAAKIPG